MLLWNLFIEFASPNWGRTLEPGEFPKQSASLPTPLLPPWTGKTTLTMLRLTRRFAFPARTLWAPMPHTPDAAAHRPSHISAALRRSIATLPGGPRPAAAPFRAPCCSSPVGAFQGRAGDRPAPRGCVRARSRRRRRPRRSSSEVGRFTCATAFRWPTWPARCSRTSSSRKRPAHARHIHSGAAFGQAAGAVRRLLRVRCRCLHKLLQRGGPGPHRRDARARAALLPPAAVQAAQGGLGRR